MAEAPLSAEEEKAIQKKFCVIGVISNTVGIGLLTGIGFGLGIPESAAISLGVNWLVYFVHGLPFDSEKFYDATGTLTYISLVVSAAIMAPMSFEDLGGQWKSGQIRGLILGAMALCWSIRLGSFLLLRIIRDGKDSRFVDYRKNSLRWLGVWTIQSLWCFMVICPTVLMISKGGEDNYDCSIRFTDYLGWAIWVFGWVVEIISDNQKNAFRKDPANKEKFIKHGMWSLSRHPNYFGEILLQIGITISASGACITGGEWLIWFSPFTTCVLLLRVSGIPLLESKADAKWGQDPEYQYYKENTPVLIMRPCPPAPYKDTGVALTENAVSA